MFQVQSISKAALLFFVMLFAAAAAFAQGEAPSGKVSIETTSMAAGIGRSWGHGTLRFNGKSYRFSIDGVTFMDFGMSKVNAAGEIYNLTDVASFEGNYLAAEAIFALGGGAGSVALQNQNGVIMHLRSVSQGMRLQLGTSGMNINLW